MPIDKPALAGRLAAYLAERAWHEGEPMRLTPADFEDALDRGIGSAFGIHWNTEGELTRDDQEPEPGFLSAWIGRQQTKHRKRGFRALSLDGLTVGRLWRRRAGPQRGRLFAHAFPFRSLIAAERHWQCDAGRPKVLRERVKRC